jgi:hypothetical protein
MATSTPRARVATVIQHQGPSANLHTAIVTAELVPMREEIFSSAQLAEPSQVADALHKMQRHLSEATQAPRSLPFLGGVSMPSVTFAANTAQTLQHGCQLGLAVTVLSMSRRAAAANSVGCLNEVSQDLPTGRITLQSTDAATYDLYFFTRPGAVR